MEEPSQKTHPGNVDHVALVRAMDDAGRAGVEDASFRRKLEAFAKRLGREAAERTVALYHCMMDPDTPASAKATIVGALAYFVLPIDLIPDVLLGVGFTDDIAAIGVAFTTVLASVKPEHVEAAKAQVAKLFGAE